MEKPPAETPAPTISFTRVLEGRKFVWDGESYENEETSRAREQAYRQQGFEVQRLDDGDRVLLYTRRPAQTGDEG